ncbi:MAG: LapA family protein [bacterium]|nr:LapA family protein [bacterium]
MKHSNRDQGKAGPSTPDTPPSGPGAEKTSFPWKVAGGGALALLLVWFVLQNSHSVRVNFLWWSGSYPMILLMAAVAVAAILVWEALALLRRRRRRPAKDR